MSIARILSIAGSDPSGGAGIQADLKSIAASGGYGMAAITALTSQNTEGVTDVFTPPASVITSQLDAISADITVDAIKTGMLANASIIEAVHAWLKRTGAGYIVIDPVMVATSGDRLLDTAAEGALRGLLPLADLVTPNRAELAVLTESAPATTDEQTITQGRHLASASDVSVLVTGGDTATATDLLITPAGEVTTFTGQRINRPHTHGTGCSLSSAIATQIVHTSGNWQTAISAAKTWLTRAIGSAELLDIGQGRGPIHHFAHVQDQLKDLS